MGCSPGSNREGKAVPSRSSQADICLLRHSSPGNLSSRHPEPSSPHLAASPPFFPSARGCAHGCTSAPHLAALDAGAGAQRQARRP
ncbi:hypothetical protein GUJ93_ZPchr0006g42658 [Zizania palustris]|uniref:Uncharacterized protein n=1 Tax=Zizania palustris TaxID=103762 RepID=A0A8J5T1R1_ZIZPA|nr:hypothetical protein GUJ93_ZPchr0006g42658 [Zizania palustris]